MESGIVIGNRTLVPLKVAASSVSYSRDYVARLAREGKIAAAQVNRQWYIDPVSLQNFCEHAQLEVLARSEYVRELRRNELESKDRWESFENNKKQRQEKTFTVSVYRTLVFVVCGLCAGFLVHVALPLTQSASLPAQLGFLFDINRSDVEEKPQTPAAAFWENIGNVYINDEAITIDNGIVLLPSGTTSEASVEELFSDPVSIINTSSSTGVISIDEKGVTTTMPFVRIPKAASVESKASSE